MNIEVFISDLSIASVLIPLFIVAIQWRKLPQELSPLRWLLIASLVCDILMHFTGLWFQNSYPVGNAFMLIQFYILLYIFRFYHRNKNIVIFLGVGYLIFYVFDISYFENFLRMPANAIFFSGLIIIILSLQYLYKLLNELSITHIHRLPMLWLTFAVLLYYACTLFVILASNYLLVIETTLHLKMWVVHNFFNITKNILFAIALWKNYQVVRRSSTLS